MTSRRWTTTSLALLLALAPGVARPDEESGEASTPVGSAAAEGAESDTDEGRAPAINIRDRLKVVGDAEEAFELPGSGQRLTEEQLEAQGYSDVHRILRLLPGINIQEEEGWGLRPNIGIRGTGVERSQKITLMEDGVLIAPAPYAAPSAYYSPTAGRMQGFEVLKGASSIRQGPFTTGGALNYVSRGIPGRLGGSAQLAGGEDGHFRGHLDVGDSGPRFGWLFEGYRLQSDGFKDLDTGGDTGFELDDYLGKLRLTSRPGAGVYQALELKLGKTEQDGDETYLGLTQGDFDRTPFRRYAGSQEDRFVSDHEQVQLSYFAQLSEGLDLTAVAYNNDFFRNWHKLQSVDGTGLSTVLDDPENHQYALDVLRGEIDSAPDDLVLRNNRREYFGRGAQAILGWAVAEGHDLEIGLRYHEDEEDRFQNEEGYQMVDGRMVLTSVGPPGSQANRISSADAWALFVMDTWAVGNWTLAPGIRYESIDLLRRDFGKEDPERTGEDLTVRRNSIDQLIPGLGATYHLSPTSVAFAGIHKGFAPPGPGSTAEVDAEEAINYELGYRYGAGTLRAEAIGFFNDYDNLLGTDTLSGGGEGTGDQFNGGAARIWGLEVLLEKEVPVGNGLAVPLRLVYTRTQSEFRTSFLTDFADWEPEVQKGDEIPYIPEDQLLLGVGVAGRAWGARVDANYVSEVRTKAGRGPIPSDELIEGRWVLDLAADYRLAERYRVFVQVRNLSDEVYVAARRPHGLRPGLSRTVIGGFQVDF